ncbi:MAG: SDR family oxidoreductase [Phycisphaerales bacterium]|nr:SDR family oxidoreductase [Phycisphaerales bacterium]MCB9862313.1 SDR family oxidoreductase [Phycisphaerales bacterium]
MGESPFSGRVCIVTGAGSGIGRAAAILLARRGAIVVAADIDRESADRVAAEVSNADDTAQSATLDVTSEAMWREVIDGVIAQHGRLDVLVNNAGISNVRPIVETSLDDWRSLMAVNLDGVFLGTRTAIAAMKGGGSIVNIASVAGIRPFGGAAAYCASKAAVRMFTKAVAIECAESGNGVRVNLVTPGGVKTPIWDKHSFFREMASQCGDREAAFALMAQGKASMAFFEAEEVAETIAYLASDASAHISGTEIVMDRGQS